MNRKLTDAQIDLTVKSLREAGQRVTGRTLRAALRREYGAAGRTDRLFSVCRSLHEPARGTAIDESLVAELRRQLLEAERRRSAAQEQYEHALARAERAEAREMAHQDRWATEIHTLRETVEQLKRERARRQSLDDQVLRLQRELQSLRRRLANYEVPPPDSPKGQGG